MLGKPGRLRSVSRALRQAWTTAVPGLPSPTRRIKGAHACSPAPSLHDSFRRAVPANLEPRSARRQSWSTAFPAAAGATALADATIYVPTQRAAEALANRCSRRAARELILPRIAPLGAFEPTRRRQSSPRATRLRAPAAARGRRVDPPHDAGAPYARLGQGARAARFAGSTRRAAARRSRKRAGAGRRDARSGLRAGRRSRRADRRHDHRGRAVGAARDADAGRL